MGLSFPITVYQKYVPTIFVVSWLLQIMKYSKIYIKDTLQKWFMAKNSYNPAIHTGFVC